MAATLEVESTLTDRYQTTVPETVRRALKLGKRDKIHYAIRPSGEVVLTRADVSGDDCSPWMLASPIGSSPWSVALKSISMRPFRQTMNDCREARASGHSRLDGFRPSAVSGAD